MFLHGDLRSLRYIKRLVATASQTVMTPFSIARAAAFAALSLSLAACATSPAPIYGGAAGGGARPVPVPGPNVGPQPQFGDLGAPEIVASARPLQCVPFARQVSGVEIYGDANTWWAQAEGRFQRGSRPAVGSVMTMEGHQTTARGHVAVVTTIVSSREIRVDHANWLNGGEVSVRVPVLDVSANNDWSEVRVWHIPGGHWGGRVYRLQGFIMPAYQQVASR
jgi:hypothetical protein